MWLRFIPQQNEKSSEDLFVYNNDNNDNDNRSHAFGFCFEYKNCFSII